MQRPEQDDAQVVFDADDLMARCLGNIEFAEHILEMFQTRFGEDLVELERYLAAGDADAVARLAHRLKGASANASARTLQTIAAEIEHKARTRSLDGVGARLGDLRSEWGWFQETASLWEACPVTSL